MRTIRRSHRPRRWARPASAGHVADRLLARLLRAPRALLALGAGLGLALIACPLVAPVPALPAPAALAAAQGMPAAQPAPAASERDAVLGVVAAYNQASITAGLLGTAEPLAPFLAPGGPAMRAADAEYARRRERGELRDAALVRWGVLDVAVDRDAARVETQEQWDVVTSVGGAVARSRRGVLTRNTYTLRRTGASAWRIVSIETVTLVA